MFEFRVQFYFEGGGAPAEKKDPLSLKRYLFPHGDRVKMQTQGFLDLFFDAAHLEYFFQLFELSTKAAFAKAEKVRREFKGQQNRGNRTESLCFQRFLRGFERLSEVFRL